MLENVEKGWKIAFLNKNERYDIFDIYGYKISRKGRVTWIPRKDLREGDKVLSVIVKAESEEKGKGCEDE